MKGPNVSFKAFSCRKVIPLLAILCATLVSAPARSSDPMVAELTKQKLPPIAEPDVKITGLSNGATVYYLKNDELPLFKMETVFELGSIYDGEDWRGMAEFFMSAWRSGGATGMSAREVDEKTEFYAAHLTASAGGDLSSFAVECLQKDMDPVLDIYFKLVQEPAFETERIEIMRKGALNSIKRRNEEPMSIAAREFKQSLYGEHSPHAWMSTPETIVKIDRTALENYYDANVSTGRMWIVASSPLEFDDFLKLMEKRLGGWKRDLPRKAYPTKIEKTWLPSVEFIQKEGNQSAIVMGHYGEKRFNPDKYKLLLADEILGGSTFGSKLGDRIRTELGLAYGVASSFEFSTDYGRFAMETRTKSESTVRTVEEMRKILADMVVNEHVTEDELKLARERILNRLVFEYADPFNVVSSQFRYDYYGYPPHYLAVFQKEVEAVTLDQIKDALAKYYFPDKLKVLIVGDRSKISDLNRLEGLVEKPLDME
jgi:zinc protease